MSSESNKDFDKFKIEGNDYPNAQRILESAVDLILVNPNEQTSFYSLIVSNVLNNVTTVETLEEALAFKSNYAIIVENDAEFSETMFIEMLIKNKQEEKAISTGNVHLLKLGQLLEDCVTDKTLEELSSQDRPFCKDLVTFRIQEEVSPWVNNLFAFNTEKYYNPFNKLKNKKFDHYVMVASGWLWAWQLTANKWNPEEEYLTLFDISSTNLLHLRNIVEKWSPWDQSFTDFILENPLAKEIFIYSGWIEGNDIEATRNHLTDLWEQEMIRWASLKHSDDPEVGWELFKEFFHNFQKSSALGKISYVNMNVISDNFLAKKLSTYTKGRSYWFISNIFTSYASRMWSAGSKDNELVWYETFKKRLNKDDVVFGRFPQYKNSVIEMVKSLDVI